jgi:hypothetical protein
VTAKHNNYQSIDRLVANQFDVALLIIPNAPLLEIKRERYSYVSANVFLSWSPLYKEITVGGIESDLFLVSGSLNMRASDLAGDFSFSNDECYDYLIIEQNVFPCIGVCGDTFYHNILLDNVVRFAEEHPDFRIAYLCRHMRGVGSNSVEFENKLAEDDKILVECGIKILPRGVPGQTARSVAKSKTIVSLNSSLRLEAILEGKLSVSLNYCGVEDDIFYLLFDYPLVVNDTSYLSFKNSLLMASSEKRVDLAESISSSGLVGLRDGDFEEKLADYMKTFMTEIDSPFSDRVCDGDLRWGSGQDG